MRNHLNVRIPLNANNQRTAPSFVVGQDEEGHWVALEAHGGGGLFVNREAAVKYAESEARRRAGVLIFAMAPVPLFSRAPLAVTK